MLFRSHSEALGGFGAFRVFLQQHPQIKSELEADPNRINNPDFVKRHPELQAFYRKHPEVPAEMEKNANDFIRREQAGMAYDQNFTNFHDYLRTHQDVREQLESNPSLADDPKFQSQHPNLHSYLEAHPEVAWQMKRDPHQFFQREEQALGDRKSVV